MKLLTLISGLFMAVSAQANLDTQMKLARGDWFLGPTNYVFRIEQQTEGTVRVLWCEPEQFVSGICSKTFVVVAQYAPQLDAFYSAGSSTMCSWSYQAGIDGKSLIMTANPLGVSKGCSMRSQLLSRMNQR